MLETIYVITDLGPGDGGKGSVIHSLAQRTNASVIIKRGGAQGSHGVRTSQGEKFNFSQWGCGTLEGIPTYCSPQMILSPVGLQNESDALKHHGIYNPYELLTVNPDCICATPYHKIESQLEEMFLKDNPRGTIGTGVGKAYRMYKEYGDGMTIRASDLRSRITLRHKLIQQLDHYRSLYTSECRDRCNAEDDEIMNENLLLLYDDNYFDYIVDTFVSVGRNLEYESMRGIIRKYSGAAIVECSHGVLTDSATGFKPHTSAIRTLPRFTTQMLRDAEFDGQILNYAAHRAYEIRHGAGPMPTYDPEFTQQMLPGSHKDENRWQGIVRAGPLDLCLLNHALSSCCETSFDGICLTWFDQILSTSRNWEICKDNTTPIIEGHQLPSKITREELFNLINKIVIEYVGIPLEILSIGPTEKDKIYKEDMNHG